MGQHFFDLCTDFISGRADNTWNWFNSLNREEWMVVLAITAISGFLCLMGMKTRK